MRIDVIDDAVCEGAHGDGEATYISIDYFAPNLVMPRQRACHFRVNAYGFTANFDAGNLAEGPTPVVIPQQRRRERKLHASGMNGVTASVAR